MKNYIALKENPAATHLEIELYYHLGGYNCFTHREEKRGYYIRVVPVTRERGYITFTAFSGIKECVKPVTRKSAKAEKEAEKLAADRVPALVEYVCNKNSLEVEKC